MESTTDPAERRKLMDEHMQSMHRGMMMMSDMMRSPPGDGARTCADSDMSCRMGRMQAEQGAMQQRMAMMQMMMDQMMGHMMQQQGTPGAGPGPERRDGDRADPKRAP
jgi:hypothetical protein